MIRKNYPISSLEINDILLLSYQHISRLLGYDGDPYVSGIYDTLEASGVDHMDSMSGIPHVGNKGGPYALGLDVYSTSEEVTSNLKWNYVFRKQIGCIKYE